MALLSMTTSLNVAEMLALRWERVNLTPEIVVVGSEMVQPFTLLVRGRTTIGGSLERSRPSPGNGQYRLALV
jgi:hypothetical protein